MEPIGNVEQLNGVKYPQKKSGARSLPNENNPTKKSHMEQKTTVVDGAATQFNDDSDFDFRKPQSLERIYGILTIPLYCFMIKQCMSMLNVIIVF